MTRDNPNERRSQIESILSAVHRMVEQADDVTDVHLSVNNSFEREATHKQSVGAMSTGRTDTEMKPDGTRNIQMSIEIYDSDADERRGV